MERLLRVLSRFAGTRATVSCAARRAVAGSPDPRGGPVRARGRGPGRFTTRPGRVRSAGQPDVLVDPGSGLSLLAPADGDLVIHLDPDDRLLILWGRCPSALRS